MTIPKTFQESYAHVRELVDRFRKNESAYLSPKYQEAEVRQEFLDKFWVALGWDVYHQEQPNPYEREVRIEKSVMVGDRGKRADYAFYTRPNFLQARFMAEAKKPSRNLENQYDCFQAVRYGWNSNTPISVLTDFEQFLVLDSRSKPSVERALSNILEKFHYTQFDDEEEFRRLYYLFAREAVGDGSLEKYVTALKKSKKTKAAAKPAAVQVEPVGDTFLAELDIQRELLAKSFKRNNEHLDGDELTEITQRTLDRLVFIRFLEDKLVEPSEIIDRLGKRSGNAWRDFAGEMPRLNSIYNGIIFKPHAILDSPDFGPDDKTFNDLLSWLSHRNSAYDFNSIPIHILGSIYERFLGKTIVTTDKRARVEEKPEVRKAGGVYYTPEYIVRYIVENTVGKLIEGRSPDEIAKMRFADIACGSGSFLLGVFDHLIAYHVEWYAANKTRRAEAIKKKLCRETEDGNLQLTLEHKRDILLNNIYGVDLDAQAVEVAQLSLYLKLLEEENAGTIQPKLTGLKEQLLPNLNRNIVHGNSLVDFDILDGDLFGTGEGKKLYPMNFSSAFPEVFANGGFDAIVGNPPYVRQEMISPLKPYLQKRFKTYHGIADLYVYFFERYFDLLKEGGEFGIIVANKWLRANYGQPLRAFLKKRHIEEVVDFGDLPVFQGATTYPCIIRARKNNARAAFRVTEVAGLDFGGSSLGEYVLENEFTVGQEALKDSGWSLTDESTQKLLNKIHLAGVPLSKFVEGRIYRGILTGLNEAFVIDDEIRARILARDLRSEELLKPFLFGREIKRYENPVASRFLIRIPKGWTRRQMEETNGFNTTTVPPLTAWKWFEKSYPAIADHLRPFADAAAIRHDKGEFWWELRACDYYDQFEKSKITYAEIASRGQFYIDETPSIVDTTAYIIGSADPYLLGLLNSRLFTFIFSKTSSVIRGGFLRWKAQYVADFPIVEYESENSGKGSIQGNIKELVGKLRDAKKSLAAARTDADRQFYERFCEKLDRDIDELVYQLYDITPEERRIIERA